MFFAVLILGVFLGLAWGHLMLPAWPWVLLLLTVTTITDLRYRKVYNLLTFPAAAFGLAYHFISGNEWFGMLGLFTGFMMLWPVYWLGATSAGDVKLLASLGAIMGKQAAIITGLSASLLFLLYAVIFYFRRGEIKKWFKLTLRNAKYLSLRQLDGEKINAEELIGSEHTAPYTPFITLGMFIFYILEVIH